jgi:hypothetical protein
LRLSLGYARARVDRGAEFDQPSGIDAQLSIHRKFSSRDPHRRRGRILMARVPVAGHMLYSHMQRPGRTPDGLNPI